MMLNQDENVFSVSEINKHLKNVIENSIPNLFVEGEIANYTHHYSGHIYFSIKDSNSTLKCVFFKGMNRLLNFKPKNGDKVICGGKITLYEKGGSYQLNVARMFPYGIGELQAKFEALKEKLYQEGIFDKIYKKKIPPFPENVGVVTSATGAAFQDIKNVLSRRFPCNIFLYPANVQGNLASKEIIKGIEYFNQKSCVDLIIIGRGGGSQEDLFCFNDEQLARAIFASKIPIISAVGHEIDFTISDFVADLRAPTPSAAAELAVPDKDELIKNIFALKNQMLMTIRQYLFEQKSSINNYNNLLERHHPKKILQIYQQRLDEASIKLEYKFGQIARIRNNFDSLREKLSFEVNTDVQKKIHTYEIKLINIQRSLNENISKVIVNRSGKLENLKTKLQELSPHEALKRGYSILQQQKKIINSVKDISINSQLDILLSDGKCLCDVKKIIEKK